MSDAIIYSSVSQVRLPGSGAASHTARSSVVRGLAHLVVRARTQGESVLAEFTAKSGNFRKVVQQILKHLPSYDNVATYQYGE